MADRNFESQRSQVSILHPRDPYYTVSSRISTDFLTDLDLDSLDDDKWQNRKEFFFQTLAFCLGLPNLWRFPKEALTLGHGTFVWTYIVSMLFIGSCLMFFEIALGQYSNKGFAKVFSMCPLFEGISYSMAFYCVITSTYYNVLNVYSFIYLFGSFSNSTLIYKTCITSFPKNVCVEGSTMQNLTPEYVFFQHRVVFFSSDDIHKHSIYELNYRNVGVLFFLWVFVCILILRGIRNARWVAMVYCPLPYIVLLATLTAALTINGASMGLKSMFYLDFNALLNADVWIGAFEQTILALGIGMGPLITIGSYSKFQSPTDRDSLLLCICTLICSLLAGSVIFCTAGVLAVERNVTMSSIFTEDDGHYSKDLSVHLMYSQLFSRLPNGISNVLSAFFFLTLLIAGWYSLITYTETFIVSCYTFLPRTHRYKVATNLGVCTICFAIGVTFTNKVGYTIFMNLDTHMVSLSLAIIILCELGAVIYIYGIHDFCDDIDFMLGFFPNIYTQTMWLISPIFLLLLLADLLSFRFYGYGSKTFERTVILTFGPLIVLPIIIVGVYNTILCYKAGNIKRVLAPRHESNANEEDTGSRTSYKSTTGPVWYKLPPNYKAPETAGPSTKTKH